MSKSSPIITASNIAVSYSKGRKLWSRSNYWALKEVSFDLFPGETLGVVGRNGVGKSTLLKTIAGIYLPDKGHILSKNVKIALLSLQVGFAQHLTGRENSILSGLYHGMTRKQIENQIDVIADFSGLGDFFDEQVKNYSTGMRARLGFSIAIRIQPDVLLIDEVLGVGDAEFRKKSSEAIKGLIRSDLTVVLVTHNPQTMKELCDRLLWIENGESIMIGPTNDVLEAYQKGLS